MKLLHVTSNFWTILETRNSDENKTARSLPFWPMNHGGSMMCFIYPSEEYSSLNNCTSPFVKEYHILKQL